MRGPRVHAITGARVIVAPGEVVENATLVVRDGLIESVASGPVESSTVPADARVWNHAGATIYPGFIESYLAVPWPPQEDALATDGPLREGRNPDPRIHPERDASRLSLPSEGLEDLRQAGFTTALVAPGDGIFRGGGAVVNLGDGGSRENLLRAGVTQHLGFEPLKQGEEGYGRSKMGVTTLLRQTFLDVRWYGESRGLWERSAGERPPFDRGLETLARAAAGEQLVIFETDDLLGTLRAGRLATELGLRAAAVGSGYEYQRLEAIQGLSLPILLPLSFPEPPKVEKDTDDLTVGLEDLRHWNAAPDNPVTLLEAGVTIAFTGHRLKDPSDLFPAVARALERGLTEDEALAALTTTPATLLTVPGLTGRLKAGSMANFFVVDGPLWTKNPKILEIWIDGRRYDDSTTGASNRDGKALDPAGRWRLLLLGGDTPQRLELSLEGSASDLEGTATLQEATLQEATLQETTGEANTVVLETATISESTVEVAFDGRPLGLGGAITLRLELRGDEAKGLGQGPDGEFAVQGRRLAQEIEEEGMPPAAPEPEEAPL